MGRGPTPGQVAGKGHGPVIGDPIISPPKEAPGIGSGPALQGNEGPISGPDPLREDPNPRDLHWLRGNGSQHPAAAAPFYRSTRKRSGALGAPTWAFARGGK